MQKTKLRTRRRVCAALLAATSLGDLAAAETTRDPSCDRSLPEVLSVGLPLDAGTELRQGEILRRTVLAPLYEGFARCPGRPLHVNVALGSDYQVLDWLARGSIDVARISDLAVHALALDGLALLEIVTDQMTEANWPPAQLPQLSARRIGSENGEKELDPAPPLNDLRQLLLDRALASPPDPELLPSHRLVFPSHLSAVSVLTAVDETRGWLADRLTERSFGGQRRREIEHHFWTDFFEHSCFHLGGSSGPGPTCAELGSKTGPAMIEIEYQPMLPSPESGSRGPRWAGERLVRDRLVITQAAASELFSHRPASGLTATTVLRPLRSSIRPELEALFGALDPDAGDIRAIPPPFRSFVQPEPHFGTRTFAFKLDESLRLLRQHQRTARHAELALVLPGGGVKAAYQSRLIDELYGAPWLANYRFDGEPSEGAAPLTVDYVVGTSGGALLGFFVARLSRHGPFDLSDLLWRPDTGERTAGEQTAAATATAEAGFLTSGDVFGFTDLLRYASLVTILLVFSLGLGACSLGRTGWLAPRAATPLATGSRATEAKRWRLRLLLPTAAMLIGIPLLVRWVTRKLTLEHVPELEGLLFAALVVVAMFADQCLVYRPGRQSRESGSRWIWGVMLLGLAIILLPCLATLVPGATAVLQRSLESGWTYATLILLLASLLFLGVRRRGFIAWRTYELWLWAGALGLGTALAILLLSSVSEKTLLHLERVPLLMWGLGLTLLVTVALRVGRDVPQLRAWLARRTQALGKETTHRIAPPLMLLVLGPLLLDLTRPPAALVAAGSWQDLLHLPSRLAVPLGGLAICVGAVLTLFSLVLALHERHSRYRLEKTKDFSDAVLFVIVGMSLAVYLVMLCIALIRPELLTLFELTPDFWIGLLIVTAVLTIGLLVWTYVYRTKHWLPRRLAGALEYLCEQHPNASLVTRRFIRLTLLAVGGLLIWNFVLAPGLYGNRIARQYIHEADRRFDRSFQTLNSAKSSSYGLSARLLTTANALEANGTRFVLALPEGEECRAMRHEPGSKWLRYRVVHRPPAPGVAEDGCRELRATAFDDLATSAELALESLDPTSTDLLRAFVFASGSPFPVFPAHRIDPGDGKVEALVDGGYSNHTPVQAAYEVRAGQVLIVNSSNPLADEKSWWSRLPRLHGELVRNGLRLPGMVYEKAQQMDRAARQELFVVSLSPRPRKGWPILTDFRANIVQWMQESADEDLNRRIGLVESWGPPNFQISLQLESRTVSESIQNAGRANSTGRLRLAPAPAR